MRDSDSPAKYGSQVSRQLSHLKLISRLLAHELHSQGGAKTISLSRDEVLEIQTSLDLYIEEVSRRQGPTGLGSQQETTLVSPRTN